MTRGEENEYSSTDSACRWLREYRCNYEGSSLQGNNCSSDEFVAETVAYQQVLLKSNSVSL